MKKVIGTTYRKEGKAGERLYQKIKCLDCGRITYERKQKEVQEALQRGCMSCKIQSRAEEKEARREAHRRELERPKVSHHPLYSVWSGMLRRCYNVNDPNYPLYGGRGITVCDEWRNDFWMFVYHMDCRPSSKHSIDRVDNDYIYCPENCRWATHSEQMSNRRNYSQAGSTRPTDEEGRKEYDRKKRAQYHKDNYVPRGRPVGRPRKK